MGLRAPRRAKFAKPELAKPNLVGLTRLRHRAVVSLIVSDGAAANSPAADDDDHPLVEVVEKRPCSAARDCHNSGAAPLPRDCPLARPDVSDVAPLPSKTPSFRPDVSDVAPLPSFRPFVDEAEVDVGPALQTLQLGDDNDDDNGENDDDNGDNDDDNGESEGHEDVDETVNPVSIDSPHLPPATPSATPPATPSATPRGESADLQLPAAEAMAFLDCDDHFIWYLCARPVKGLKFRRA